MYQSQRRRGLTKIKLAMFPLRFFEPILWTCIVAVSYLSGSFYYRAVAFSVIATRLYYVILLKRSFRIYSWTSKATKLLFFILLLLWCLILSPLHIFVFIPGVFDRVSRSGEGRTYLPTEVLHDPGKNAQVE